MLNGISIAAGLRLRLAEFLRPSTQFRDALFDACKPFDNAALGQAKVAFLGSFRCALASLIAVSGVNGLAQGIQNTDGSSNLSLGGLNHDILHSDSNAARLLVREFLPMTGPSLGQPLRAIHLLTADGMCPRFAKTESCGGFFCCEFCGCFNDGA